MTVTHTDYTVLARLRKNQSFGTSPCSYKVICGMCCKSSEKQRVCADLGTRVAQQNLGCGELIALFCHSGSMICAERKNCVGINDRRVSLHKSHAFIVWHCPLKPVRT